MSLGEVYVWIIYGCKYGFIPGKWLEKQCFCRIKKRMAVGRIIWFDVRAGTSFDARAWGFHPLFLDSAPLCSAQSNFGHDLLVCHLRNYILAWVQHGWNGYLEGYENSCCLGRSPLYHEADFMGAGVGLFR